MVPSGLSRPGDDGDENVVVNVLDARAHARLLRARFEPRIATEMRMRMM